MESICGVDCNVCRYGNKNGCKGCKETNGCPFGKQCFIAKYILMGGKENYELFKEQLIEEINSLEIPGMPKINNLNQINGSLVNLSYPLPNGVPVKLLNDKDIYLATQVKSEYNDGSIVRCFGVVVNMGFVLISEFGPNGEDPDLILFKKR